MSFDYPEARRDDSIVNDYHGTKVPDPYQWLEDPDADETKAFVDAQNAVTIPFLNKCSIKDKLNSRLTELWDFPKYSCPKKEGERYFYYYNTGLQNQSVLYVQDSLDGEARVFLDPNTLSEDGTTAISGTAFSEDGLVFAYGLSKAGSDWVTIKFRDVESGEDLPDTLEYVKFSCMAWTHDSKGLFYNKYPKNEGKSDGTETATNLNQKLFYHLLGTSQEEDILCAEFPDQPKWMPGAEVSDCGKYVLLSIREGCDPVNRLYFAQLADAGITGLLDFTKVVDNFDAEYKYITNEGSVFTFKTNLNASRYKLINIDFNNYNQEHWTTLIEQHDADVLEWATCVSQSKLLLCYLHDVKSELYMHELSDARRITQFPMDIGTVVGFFGKKKLSEIFYQFTSFLTPGIIYRCDLSGDSLPEPKIFRQIEVKNFDASMFETKQEFYQSKDGTKIPIFIVHRKDIVKDGNQPVLLYGYGGFSISITPNFSVSRIVWMQHFKGIYAIANIRGGGEYGETWHKAGCYGKKQNVFDDFQAAAQYLVDSKYTRSQRIAIQGGSNGGLLVGACCNQRPDLFGCGIAQVGVMDMLKFQKFTIGHAWTTDFGSSDNKEDFEWLYKYSPLHNIRVPEGDVQYPAILLTTGDHDDRVVPLHTLKYIAQLQHTLKGQDKQKHPLMVRVETKAGHGFGKPTKKIIEELTDMYSFIVLNLEVKWQD